MSSASSPILALPPFSPLELVQERLLALFPEGSTPNRNYCTRDMAGATVFTMLYVGAVDGSGRYFGPKQVIKMSDAQAALDTPEARFAYAAASIKPRYAPPQGPAWYADNSREPIRDETIRQGLIPVGAVVELEGVPTTSPQPRYALARDFAALFDPALNAESLAAAMDGWRSVHLTKAALARIQLLRSGASKDATSVTVTLPDGSTHTLAAGESSLISKQVIEAFAPRFLENPAVLWVSESGNKVVEKHDLLTRTIGLNIDAARNLPDIILADLGGAGVLLVFVEVVATAGEVNAQRRQALLDLVHGAGLTDKDVAFVSAYMDRTASAFKRTVSTLAWNTFVWFAGEPDELVALHGSTGGARLRALLPH